MNDRSLIVVFDLAEPEQNLETLVRKIKAYKTWARLGSFAYLIFTVETPVSVRDDLKKVLRSGDRLFVGVSARPAAWWGMPEAVSKWILENQKN